jgi:hypothetical protein
MPNTRLLHGVAYYGGNNFNLRWEGTRFESGSIADLR